MERNQKQKEFRMNRIKEIENIVFRISQQGKRAGYKSLIAEFCISKGLSKRTVKEYVDLLIDSGRIIKNGDEIYSENKEQDQRLVKE